MEPQETKTFRIIYLRRDAIVQTTVVSSKEQLEKELEKHSGFDVKIQTLKDGKLWR